MGFFLLLFYSLNDILLAGSDNVIIFLSYFGLFFLYSVIGWIVESFYVSVQINKLVNRGFLIGPYCPIYGCGALGVVCYLDQYKNNILTVFLLAVVVCSFLEYVTSFLMEKLFKARWWDYSDKKFNLNGRICGQNSLLFGLGGVVIIYIVHPFIKSILANIPSNIIFIINIIFFVIFFTDVIVSFNIINKFKNTVSSIDVKKDSSQEFARIVRETLFSSHKVFQKRLLSAFPNVDFTNFNNLKETWKLITKK